MGIHTMVLTWKPETNPQAKLRTTDENTDTHTHTDTQTHTHKHRHRSP